jgi:hypothetical protein
MDRRVIDNSRRAVGARPRLWRAVPGEGELSMGLLTYWAEAIYGPEPR